MALDLATGVSVLRLDRRALQWLVEPSPTLVSDGVAQLPVFGGLDPFSGLGTE